MCLDIYVFGSTITCINSHISTHHPLCFPSSLPPSLPPLLKVVTMMTTPSMSSRARLRLLHTPHKVRHDTTSSSGPRMSRRDSVKTVVSSSTSFVDAITVERVDR